MNKDMLVRNVAKKLNITQKSTLHVINDTLDVLTQLLKNSDSISFHGLGTLSTKTKKEYNARIPGSGERIIVAKTTKAKFKMSRKLKVSINS